MKDGDDDMKTMTPRNNLIATLGGHRPAWIPYTVNQEFVTDDLAWDDLFDAGLCRIPYVHTVREEMTDVERMVEPIIWQGQPGRRVTLRFSGPTSTSVSMRCRLTTYDAGCASGCRPPRRTGAD